MKNLMKTNKWILETFPWDGKPVVKFPISRLCALLIWQKLLSKVLWCLNLWKTSRMTNVWLHLSCAVSENQNKTEASRTAEWCCDLTVMWDYREGKTQFTIALTWWEQSPFKGSVSALLPTWSICSSLLCSACEWCRNGNNLCEYFMRT